MKFIGKCLLIETDKKRILAIGDLHLGFEESLNQSGVFVSRKMYEEMINYLEKVFEKIGQVDEVVLLGDVKHEFGMIMRQEWNDVLGLFDYLGSKCGRIVIVKGNHDKIIEPLAKRRGVDVKDYYIVEEYCFLHGDRDFVEIYSRDVSFWIMGHAHPSVKISDGVKVEKYKCFFVGKFKDKEVVVVPSFFEGNAGSDPRENELGLAWAFDFNKFTVKIVGEENLDVLDFGKLGKLN